MDGYLGEIRLFPYTFAPQGWLFCNGQTLPISQYTALFSILGITFGGDGVRNFKLPNLAGNIPVGAGQGVGLSSYALGQTGGSKTVTLNSTQQLPPHTHTLNAVNVDGTSPNATSNQPAIAAVGPRGQQTIAPAYGSGALAAMSGSILSFAGGGGPHNNMQPYLVLNFCICLNGEFPIRP